jgi:SAM-dependent methyltransferase
MSNVNEQRLYRDLAWLFPILTPYKNYEEEGKFFLGKILEYAVDDAETLLDIGCGGGHTHHYFRERFKVTGIDVNPEILEQAKKLNPDVEYIQGDMRSFRLNRTFDAITIFDSINYVTTKEDLRSTFETAYIHLKTGGVLLTYVENEPEKFVQHRTTAKTRAKGDIELTYIANNYDPDLSDANFECTFIYLIRRKGKLEIKSDRHLCGIFRLDTWVELMEDVGFEVHQSKFEHSEFKPVEEPPLLIGIKQ